MATPQPSEEFGGLDQPNETCEIPSFAIEHNISQQQRYEKVQEWILHHLNLLIDIGLSENQDPYFHWIMSMIPLDQ